MPFSTKETRSSPKVGLLRLWQFLAGSYSKVDCKMNSMRQMERKVKTVLVGDACTGKTSFAFSWETRTATEHVEYVPTIFDGTKDSPVDVGDRKFLLTMLDMSGQEEMDNLRILSYCNADIFLLFFSYDSLESLNSIRSKWVPEITSCFGKRIKRAVFMLVGVRFNVCEDYRVLEAMGESPFRDSPVTDEMVQEVIADIRADCFMECCPLINHSVQMVVDKALEILVEKEARKKRRWWQRKKKGNNEKEEKDTP